MGTSFRRVGSLHGPRPRTHALVGGGGWAERGVQLEAAGAAKATRDHLQHEIRASSRSSAEREFLAEVLGRYLGRLCVAPQPRPRDFNPLAPPKSGPYSSSSHLPCLSTASPRSPSFPGFLLPVTLPAPLGSHCARFPLGSTWQPCAPSAAALLRPVSHLWPRPSCPAFRRCSTPRPAQACCCPARPQPWPCFTSHFKPSPSSYPCSFGHLGPAPARRPPPHPGPVLSSSHPA